jgi:hypothetical protein
MCALLCQPASAQKQVFSYPFEFEKSFLQKSDYEAYFLQDGNADRFAFILKDNKKVEYVQVDKTFKVLSTVKSDIDNTVFDITEDYLGGTSENGVFNFVYKVSDKKAFSREKIYYQVESVNFNTKTISNKKAFEISKEEKPLTSFSDNNRYFSITCNDKTSEIKLYMLTATGDPLTKTIAFKVPGGVDKDRRNISGYLGDLKLIKGNEEPGLESVVQSAKLFSAPNSLSFVINDADAPTHIFTIDLPNFSTNEKFIDHSAETEKGKASPEVNSFLYDNKLFSLILNKNNVKIAVYSMQDGALLKSYEVNEETGFDSFAQTPVFEQRLGKKATEKNVDDVSKLIKAFNKGTEGLMVYQNKKGQYIITAGSYDLVPVSSGSSGMPTGHWTGGGAVNTYAGTPTIASSYYVSTGIKPGTPYYATTSARYYKTTYFKMLLDSSSCKITNGNLPLSVNAQIKDFLDDADKKAKATNQFALSNGQYYGYYDANSNSYIIDQIFIAK